MNKKGFTLVELLATIIILGLLTLLASTSVTKVLKESKGDLYKTQIKLVESAAEAWGAENIDKLPNAGECKYLTLKNLQDYGLIDKDITNPKTGKKIDNNINIKISTSKTGYGNDVINYEIDPDSIEGCSHAMPCTLISGEAYTIGAKYSCDFGDGKRNFYILELGSNKVQGSTLKDDEVALILEGNYDTTTQPWCASGRNNSCNADGLTSKLDEIAEAWKELEREQIGLPSAIQVATADGIVYTDYPDYPRISSTNAWLYNWPDNANYGHGAPSGYWTSTPHAGNSYSAWFVYYLGDVGNLEVDYDFDFGVRPVITISKSNV